VTHLRKIMLEELQRRNYFDGTIRHPLRAAEEFARYFGLPPTSLVSPHCALINPTCARTGSWRSEASLTMSPALRLFFARTPKRPEFRDCLP